MFKPQKVPLTIYQGATFGWFFVWKAGPTVATATPVDLTGCIARAQMRERIDSSTVLLELTTENGRIVLGGADGSIRLNISAVDTTAITWRSAVYDLEIEFPGGTVVRLIYGNVTVSPEVTRGS